jgi:hypothetical protein
MNTKETIIDEDIELWDADPDCDHEIVDNFWSGGGVKCKKCGGWCCY